MGATLTWMFCSKSPISEIEFCSVLIFLLLCGASTAFCGIKRCMNTNCLEVSCVTTYFGSVAVQMKRFSVCCFLSTHIAGSSEFWVCFITNSHKSQIHTGFPKYILLSISRGFNLHKNCLDCAEIDLNILSRFRLENSIFSPMEPIWYEN